MQLTFAKYVGCGNDFILFDNREESFPKKDESLIRSLCHRQFGIGADGVILLESSSKADFSMRIYNADGSEAEMCGNGIRCLMRFLEHLGLKDPSYSIETMHKILLLEHHGKDIRVEMGIPNNTKWNISFNENDSVFQLHYLDTGVPHIVLFVDEIESFDLKKWGPHLRYHKLFAPKGTNVNIAQRLPNDEIKIRTYERGVEGETLACGTGATAVALAAAYCYQIRNPITIQTGLGQKLTIDFEQTGLTFENVTLTGPATRTFKGTIDLY
ncbi:MAG: diaminopimelate epimerase [Parachlamydiaceae bacterium]|nr:diaminopimelate epimerase [Parachlamydiaceae bacterium]